MSNYLSLALPARSDITTLLRQVAGDSVTKDTRAASFWAYHAARMSFFITQVGLILWPE